MNAFIDYQLCFGCCACEELCPSVFEIRAEQAWVISGGEFTQDCEGAMYICPVGAITVEE